MRVGQKIPGWCDPKAPTDDQQNARALQAQNLRRIEDEEHSDWHSDPIGRAMGQALAREHRAWRDYGDDEDALRAITVIVAHARTQWAAQAAIGRTSRAGGVALPGIDRTIAAGILAAWKDPYRGARYGKPEKQDLL